MRAAPAFLLVCGLWACGTDAPPVLTQVPDFELVRENGEPFGSDELRGSPWVANFIFTTCPSVCPTLTTQMGNLESRTRDVGAHFVSFTVDPGTDSPEVLTRYARSHQANLDRWAFLSGDASELRRVIEEGLRMRMGERGEDFQAGDDIMHGAHFVLVDGEGRIRGFYRNEGEELERLEAHLRALGR